MQRLSEFKPSAVWGYFEEILAIPRISKHESGITEYLEAFAQRHDLKHERDTVGNLLISKVASPGMEDRKGIILQSHLDMVGEANAHVQHDFHKDPIVPVLDGRWIKAKETTLGADDGIGIAASMAILADNGLRHGPLECLFTVDEESGMTGAFGLQPGFITGSILLNLDSEDEGEIFIGCAGGVDTVATLPLRTKRAGRNLVALKVVVNGLQGGHSGDEIHKGLGNSIKILNRFLWNADRRFSFRLAHLEGGKARNAIPREASAVIVVRNTTLDLLRVYSDSFTAIVKSEYEDIEADLNIRLEEVPLPDSVIRKKLQRKIFNALNACINGVVTMSREIPGLVETSTNLASVRQEDDVMEIVTSQRSSVESAKWDISDRMASLFSLLGARVKHSDGYPGWKPNMNSEILNVSRKVYKDLFGKEAQVKAIHAGLECGLFLQKYPKLDMISFGPTIKGAHTPEERIEIKTVEKFWNFLLRMLEETPH